MYAAGFAVSEHYAISTLVQYKADIVIIIIIIIS
jgi:hypothetical protein